MIETDWRQRSGATWLGLRDENTNFFYKYANHRKSVNTIWEMENENGMRSLRALVDLTFLENISRPSWNQYC